MSTDSGSYAKLNSDDFEEFPRAFEHPPLKLNQPLCQK
jgi:hypothetical protein